MVSGLAVAITASLHSILGVSFFIEQKADLCSNAPTLASWLFIIGFFDLLLDIEIFPLRYRHLPYLCQVAAETVMSLLLVEFSALIVWCTIENITCRMIKIIFLVAGLRPKIYMDWEQYILGTATTALSLTFLICVGYATDHFYLLQKKSVRLCRKIIENCTKLWQNSLRIVNLRAGHGKIREDSEQSNNCCPVSANVGSLNYDDVLQPNKFETTASPYRRRNRSRRRYRR
ncbi:uncharacterized protein LOC109612834 [Musca domestica]|uniref:Uncharacterized protein LOC109612834 n=1 Tax=Musca domestica TaxID=7370 RepID=A0A9J7IH35_MUSDO|nr:uncharacterized protein LOC109612834 [Musca domestica]